MEFLDTVLVFLGIISMVHCIPAGRGSNHKSDQIAIFNEFDADNSGNWTFAEASNFLDERLNISNYIKDKYGNAMTFDQHLTEVPPNTDRTKERIYFDYFDQDNSYTWDATELKKAMFNKVDESICRDGIITLEEHLKRIRVRSHSKSNEFPELDIPTKKGPPPPGHCLPPVTRDPKAKAKASFKKYDADKSGSWNFAEASNFLDERLNISNYIKDKYGNAMTFDQHLTEVPPNTDPTKERTYFDYFDQDNSATWDASELKMAMFNKVDESICRDGIITLEEHLKQFRVRSHSQSNEFPELDIPTNKGSPPPGSCLSPVTDSSGTGPSETGLSGSGQVLPGQIHLEQHIHLDIEF